MFIVHIENLDNDAFAKNASGEVARILSDLANQVDDAMIEGVILRDFNGNEVGKAWLDPRAHFAGGARPLVETH